MIKYVNVLKLIQCKQCVFDIRHMIKKECKTCHTRARVYANFKSKDEMIYAMRIYE